MTCPRCRNNWVPDNTFPGSDPERGWFNVILCFFCGYMWLLDEKSEPQPFTVEQFCMLSAQPEFQQILKQSAAIQAERAGRHRNN